MPDIDSIRRQLKNHPEIKLGFVVYRPTYSDDSRWARFMDHLNTRVRITVENAGDGDVFTHVDWDVQEDPALQDADEETVRRQVTKTTCCAFTILTQHTQPLRNLHLPTPRGKT